MELSERWERLLEALREYLGVLKAVKSLPVLVGGEPAEDEVEAASVLCRDRLAEVLLDTGEHLYLGRRIENARHYYLDGEWGAAVWEANNGLKRAELLCRLVA